MIGSNPGQGGPEGPPDGDYARYVERLLQRNDLQREAAQSAAVAKKGGKDDGATHSPHLPASATTPMASDQAARKARGKAPARGLPGRWILLLWLLLVLLMWFAPALLPLAIGCAVAAGVGYALWKARRTSDDGRR